MSIEQTCVSIAQHHEDVQGYVRFSDIAKNTGVSRQAIDLAFQRAVKQQLITEKQLQRWKQSYQLRTTRAEFRLLRSHEVWLKQEAEELGISWHDLLNRVLTDHIHNQNHDQLQQRSDHCPS